jgi:hypothetical protein
MQLRNYLILEKLFGKHKRGTSIAVCVRFCGLDFSFSRRKGPHGPNFIAEIENCRGFSPVTTFMQSWMEPPDFTNTISSKKIATP